MTVTGNCFLSVLLSSYWSAAKTFLEILKLFNVLWCVLRKPSIYLD